MLCFEKPTNRTKAQLILTVVVFTSYSCLLLGFLKPVFHSIIISPLPAKNYDSKTIFSHSFAAKEISSGPPVVDNFLLLLHLLFIKPKNNE